MNNAVATVFGPADGISPEEFKRVSEVTYLGQVYGTLAALTHMRALGGGTIVQVGSALAYRSIPLQPAYCAAKAAVRGFTDSLRSELIHERSPIRLSMVHLPGSTHPSSTGHAIACRFGLSRSRLSMTPPLPPRRSSEPREKRRANSGSDYQLCKRYWAPWLSPASWID